MSNERWLLQVFGWCIAIVALFFFFLVLLSYFSG